MKSGEEQGLCGMSQGAEQGEMELSQSEVILGVKYGKMWLRFFVRFLATLFSLVKLAKQNIKC